MGKIRNRVLALAALCVFSALLNTLAAVALKTMLGMPLYLDTVFTAAAAFYGGLVPGLVTGLLTNLIINTVWFNGWTDYFYAICNCMVALVTVLFVRFCPDELDLGREDLPLTRRSGRLSMALYRLTALFLLAFALVVAVSVSGGIIAFCIKALTPGSAGMMGPEVFYVLPLSERAWPSLLVEITSRIPVNVLDRLLTAFCGYALAWTLKAVLRRMGKG
jgi:hypothetical protein